MNKTQAMIQEVLEKEKKNSKNDFFYYRKYE